METADPTASVGSAPGRRPGSAGALRVAVTTMRRPGRGAAVTLLLVLPLMGAVAGALLRRPPSDGYRAVAVVVPPATGSPGVLAPLEASRLLAGLVNLGLVGGPASVQGGSQSTAPGVSASAAGSGSLEIRARGRSAGEAEAQANAVAADVSSVVGQMSARAAGAGELVLGDFEHGTGGWGGVSSFSTAPASITLDRQAPRFGTADLVVGCGVASGCGITDNVTYAFAARVTYTASAWVRAVGRPLFITLILGRGVDDYAESRPVAVGPAWQRVSLAWSPRTASSAAELDVHTEGSRTVVTVRGCSTVSYASTTGSTYSARASA